MFEITKGKGFKMTFANGYTISVQFGSMNYCSNRLSDLSVLPYLAEVSKVIHCCATAEVAVWSEDGKWATKEFFSDLNDNVAGYITPDEVAAVIAQVVNKNKN